MLTSVLITHIFLVGWVSWSLIPNVDMLLLLWFATEVSGVDISQVSSAF